VAYPRSHHGVSFLSSPHGTARQAASKIFGWLDGQNSIGLIWNGFGESPGTVRAGIRGAPPSRARLNARKATILAARVILIAPSDLRATPGSSGKSQQTIIFESWVSLVKINLDSAIFWLYEGDMERSSGRDRKRDMSRQWAGTEIRCEDSIELSRRLSIVRLHSRASDFVRAGEYPPV
jgi:hypothetical protein